MNESSDNCVLGGFVVERLKIIKVISFCSSGALHVDHIRH